MVGAVSSTTSEGALRALHQAIAMQLLTVCVGTTPSIHTSAGIGWQLQHVLFASGHLNAIERRKISCCSSRCGVNRSVAAVFVAIWQVLAVRTGHLCCVRMSRHIYGYSPSPSELTGFLELAAHYCGCSIMHLLLRI